jgi:hypothetical protein
MRIGKKAALRCNLLALQACNIDKGDDRPGKWKYLNYTAMERRTKMTRLESPP